MTEAELAQALYERILRLANKFLYNASSFEISVLQNENPTYEALAEKARVLANFVSVVLDDVDIMMAHKANEYVYIMHEMGIAISNGDTTMLEQMVTELEKKPGC